MKMHPRLADPIPAPSRRPPRALATAGAVVLAGAAAAQPPPAKVEYTEAREHAVRRTIELPGTVEARTSSLVASEVEGVVQTLLAREGQSVAKGQALVRLRTGELDLRLQAADGQLREAAARLQQAEGALERARDLHGQGVLSDSQFDESRYEHDAWRGRVDQLRAEIARLRLDIERSSVLAPFAGVVVAERCQVGEWVARGNPVAELASVHDVEVRIDVPEQFFGQLRVGASASVTLTALPGHVITGRVSAVIPKAGAQARTFPVKVRVRNERGKLGVGMLAHVSLPAGDAYRATVVPKDAVITRGSERLVYRIKDDATVDAVRIEAGAAVGDWLEVREGLRPGAKVVTRGNERLQPGQLVAAVAGSYALP